MLSKAFIRKFENQVAKKMNKGFHPESYCCVDRVVVEVGDCEGYYTIQVRCGYYYGEDNSKYKQTNFTFAFDNISDYDLIHKKLKMIRKTNPNKGMRFYVLVGFESTDAKDIENAFIRIELLLRYGCLPYIMRFQNKNETPWKESKYRSLYVAIARWCNQPNIIKKMSFRQFCEANQALKKNQEIICSTLKAMRNYENEFPDIAKKYFDIRMEDIKVR